MILRQITLATEPPQVFTLYFDSRSNAEIPLTQVADRLNTYSIADDYKQVLHIHAVHVDKIVSDLITDLSEKFRAEGEIEMVRGHAELRFESRVDGDPVIKALANKKKAQKMAANMQRVPSPPGLVG